MEDCFKFLWPFQNVRTLAYLREGGYFSIWEGLEPKWTKISICIFTPWHFLWTFVIKAIWTFSDLKQFLAFYFKKCTSWGLLSVVLVANFEKAWRPNEQRYQILFLHAHTSKNSFYKWIKIIISRTDVLVHLLNNRERGMASTPKMEYQVFLCIFQKNSAMARFEGNGKISLGR